jgi:hypothetical protein
MNQVLKEYVSLMLEKLRSESFDWKQFKSLTNIKEMFEYADKTLVKLGKGSSRAAYVLSSRYVLKVAFNEKGTAQNEAEVKVYSNPQTREIVTTIHDNDPEFRWIVADIVRPMSSEPEFHRQLGVAPGVFRSAVKRGISAIYLLPEKPQVLATALLNLIRKNDLVYDDLLSHEHWGKTPDGRLVVLDYGLSEDVMDKHY